jgi:hypothetical protein
MAGGTILKQYREQSKRPILRHEEQDDLSGDREKNRVMLDLYCIENNDIAMTLGATKNKVVWENQ